MHASLLLGQTPKFKTARRVLQKAIQDFFAVPTRYEMFGLPEAFPFLRVSLDY